MSTAVSLEPRIKDVRVTDELITADLADGPHDQCSARMVMASL